LVIAFRTATFEATTAKPRFEVSSLIGSVAGFLATSVATGTAAALGIAIATVRLAAFQAGAVESSRLGAAGRSVLSTRRWLAAGCYIYIVVGIVVFLVFLTCESKAPGMMSTFALSVLGWLAGAFAAAFKAP
jgi:hypothetical protein